MYTDLFTALLDQENPRGHPILAALVYLFCPAAARWWLAGADPVIPFDPLWQALADLVSGNTLKAALASYGFADLLDIAQTYVEQVEAWRNRHPGIRAPECLPTFPGGRIEMSRRFGLRAAIRKFGDRWDNFFTYVRAWAFVAPDWEARLRFASPPHFSRLRLAFALPGIRRPVYYPAWSWWDQVENARRVVLGLLATAKNQDQIRFGLAGRASLVGDRPWPALPEVWALERGTGGADHFEERLPRDDLPRVVAQLAQAAQSGPHPPTAALRGSARCAGCGFSRQCYTDAGEISVITLAS